MNQNQMLKMLIRQQEDIICKMYHQLQQVQEDCDEVIKMNRLHKLFLHSEGLEGDFRLFTIENEFKEEKRESDG
jgi:ABC-type Mn2+/Zn2+ transport system ATPase subunit